MSGHVLSSVVAVGLLGLGGWLIRFSVTGSDDAVTGAATPYRRATRAFGIDDNPRAMRILWAISGTLSSLVGLTFAVGALLAAG